MIPHELIPEQLREYLDRPDVQIAVVVGLAGILLVLLVGLLSRKGKSGGIVLVGPVAGGKTTLFLQLRDSTDHNGTVTSMQENEAVLSVASRQGKRATVKVLDVPGHSRLRNKLERSLRECKGVVFVVDSAQYTSQKQDTAEILFEVLSHKSIARGRVPVLIACNKADLDDQAFSIEFIRKNLEKTLDAMRKTKANSFNDGSTAAVGVAGKPFVFQELKSKVSFAAVSALNGEVDDVRDFIVTL